MGAWGAGRGTERSIGRRVARRRRARARGSRVRGRWRAGLEARHEHADVSGVAVLANPRAELAVLVLDVREAVAEPGWDAKSKSKWVLATLRVSLSAPSSSNRLKLSKSHFLHGISRS